MTVWREKRGLSQRALAHALEIKLDDLAFDYAAP
jgi:ribosome-binding protein aMBF1 (putative translation factor)